MVEDFFLTIVSSYIGEYLKRYIECYYLLDEDRGEIKENKYADLFIIKTFKNAKKDSYKNICITSM